MKKFEKTYIGKGKQIGDLQIVRVSCKIAELVKLAHEYKGEQYITFEVAKLQFLDSFVYPPKIHHLSLSIKK